ncbi:DDE-type integrase/transposase/recombinase [Citricoccus sp. K5]|uniref:DDE-type integrase/transposase/recombinase n=1 Tax=Citricoccus sp. K5 TaxID=2653135 RepID=UPI0012F43EF1|nr:DDE-type integrase/transposase/recombinase [Citricoccus sp. K5]VXA97466.1 Integrase, catalytic region [Citricoccus sp. K5]
MERAYARANPDSDRAAGLIENERDLVGELTDSGGLSERGALGLIGVARSTWHYRRHPRPGVPAPVPHADRGQPQSLTDAERALVAGRILAAWQAGESVDQAYATAWDEGVYAGSQRTWWRIAATLDQGQRPGGPGTRCAAGDRDRPAPQLLATGPNQVWSWDITDFKGPYSRQVFKVYSVIDIYSRRIVAYRVEDREADRLAVQMFAAAFTAAGTAPGYVHADNGAVMRSNALAGFLAGHGVELTHNRPYVSNDNPYSESEFRTLKTRPNYPKVFADLPSARDYVDAHVVWHNTTHRHGGIALFTPDQLHDGTWIQAHRRRHTVQQAYYLAHPARYRHRVPTTAMPPAWSGINHPGPEPEQHRNWLQTG